MFCSPTLSGSVAQMGLGIRRKKNYIWEWDLSPLSEIAAQLKPTTPGSRTVSLFLAETPLASWKAAGVGID